MVDILLRVVEGQLEAEAGAEAGLGLGVESESGEVAGGRIRDDVKAEMINVGGSSGDIGNVSGEGVLDGNAVTEDPDSGKVEVSDETKGSERESRGELELERERELDRERRQTKAKAIWEKAFWEVIPKRKFDVVGRKSRRSKHKGEAGTDAAVVSGGEEDGGDVDVDVDEVGEAEGLADCDGREGVEGWGGGVGGEGEV